MKKVFEKAPAKIILIGEHAVVYGFPAITTTINLHAGCEISSLDLDGIHLIVPVFGIDETMSWEELWNCHNRNKDNFDKFRETSNRKYLLDIKNDPGALPKSIIVETFDYCKFRPKTGILIEGVSEIPTGGFGSSSAAGAAFIKALNKYFDLGLSKSQMIEILIKAESIFQGYKVSGLDQIAVFEEGLIQFKKINGEFEYKQINQKNNFFDSFLIIDSGRPENTTGEVVTSLAVEKENNPEKINPIFEKIKNHTIDLINSISNEDNYDFFEIIDKVSDELIKLGIVREKTVKLINDIQKLGGHAKISGAGAISGVGSGAVICFSKNMTKIKSFLDNNNYPFYQVEVV